MAPAHRFGLRGLAGSVAAAAAAALILAGCSSSSPHSAPATTAPATSPASAPVATTSRYPGLTGSLSTSGGSSYSAAQTSAPGSAFDPDQVTSIEDDLAGITSNLSEAQTDMAHNEQADAIP